MQSLQPLSRTLACRQAPRCLSRRAEQCFHDSAIRHSGHSRWSTIKHDKAKADAGRNKRNSIFAQELALASKCGFYLSLFVLFLLFLPFSDVTMPIISKLLSPTNPSQKYLAQTQTRTRASQIS